VKFTKNDSNKAKKAVLSAEAWVKGKGSLAEAKLAARVVDTAADAAYLIPWETKMSWALRSAACLFTPRSAVSYAYWCLDDREAKNLLTIIRELIPNPWGSNDP
jgi:hypothetical protein